MKAGYSLAWAEGAHLTQQHFQCWDQLLQEAHESWVKAFIPYAYGLMQCEWDEEAIRQGICRLKTCKYLTPTGQVVAYQADTMPVVQCELKEHAGNIIYMQWVQNNVCQGLTGYSTCQTSAQYDVSYHAVKDMHDGERVQELALKRYHIVLSQHAQTMEGACSVAIARVQHQMGSHYVFDHSFIPSTLCLSASPGLKLLLQRILSDMSKKLLVLKKQLDKKWDAKAYVDLIQLSQTWVSLNLMHRHQTAHPHQLYEKLAKLIYQSQLSWPDYQHADLTATFSQIETQLKSLWVVNTLPEEDKISLTPMDAHHLWTGPVSSEIVDACDWYLGVNVQSEDFTWIRQFVQQVKLATQETLPSVLMSALPGIALQHVQRPPTSVTLKSGYEYFRLKKHDAYWESLVHHKNLMVYLPKPFHQAVLTLDIVRE